MPHGTGNQYINYLKTLSWGKDIILRKDEFTTQKPLTAIQKAILDYLKAHSTATGQEVAAALGNITEDSVKYKRH
jgi:hypothetical protein